MKLSVTTLGRFRLLCNGQPVTGFVSQKKAEALMVYLICNPGVHTRPALATLFWGDYPEERALNNLSVLLSSIRKQLRPFLNVTRQTIAIDEASSTEADVRTFQQMIRSAPSATTINEPTSPPEQWTAAVDLYQGEFLHGFYVADAPDFEVWVRIERERLRQLAITTLEQLVATYLAKGQFDEGIAAANRSLRLDNLNEEAHRQLMRLLALNGQRAQALAQYERCHQLLDDELGVEPDPETEALVEGIRAGMLDRKDRREEEKKGGQEALTPPPFLSSSPQVAPAVQRRLDPYAVLARLDPLPDQELFGVETVRTSLEKIVQITDRPWLIALDGIGGIGKTTLANSLVHTFINSDRFVDIGWVSAKQEEFLPDVGIQSTARAALDVETLTDTLLEQLDETFRFTMSSREKRAALMRRLKEAPHLIVVDNLETVVDYQVLIPYLRQLANPSKFLITTRFTLKQHSDIFCYSLTELGEAETLAFLRHEAKLSGLAALQNASNEQLVRIYSVVGGNPLALKLVIGQVNFLPLPQVLENLQEAQGERIDALYTYIYWQAWQMLDDAARRLFLAMPTVHNGTFMQLSIAAMLEPDTLQAALQRLVDLSLVQVGGDLDEPRYRLHRLTETFLMNEVLKWSAPS